MIQTTAELIHLVQLGEVYMINVLPTSSLQVPVAVAYLLICSNNAMHPNACLFFMLPERVNDVTSLVARDERS